MERKRIEEFSVDGKNFIYLDWSGIKSNEEFTRAINEMELAIAQYPEQSLYTITNIENVRFDTESKEIVARHMKLNKPYVKYGAVIGLDGIKKTMINTLLKLSERDNMFFAFTKAQAIELLLQQE